MKKIQCPNCNGNYIAQSVIDNTQKSCMLCHYFWKVGLETKGRFYSEIIQQKEYK